jgi:hypothetical protein
MKKLKYSDQTYNIKSRQNERILTGILEYKQKGGSGQKDLGKHEINI